MYILGKGHLVPLTQRHIINANLGRDDDDGTAMLVRDESQHFCFALQSSFETRAFNCRSLITYHEKRCRLVITVRKVFNCQDPNIIIQSFPTEKVPLDGNYGNASSQWQQFIMENL